MTTTAALVLLSLLSASGINLRDGTHGRLEMLSTDDAPAYINCVATTEGNITGIDPADCGCIGDEANWPETFGNYQDPRCCMLPSFGKNVDINGVAEPTMQVTLVIESDSATDGWWVMSNKGDLVSGLWKIGGTPPTCKVFSGKKKGDEMAPLNLPYGWSGNFFATTEGYLTVDQKNPGARAEVEITVKATHAGAPNFDITAIPPGSPGQCLAKEWENQLCPFDSGVRYGLNDDKACNGGVEVDWDSGSPGNPEKWVGDNVTAGTCHHEERAPAYRKGWFGQAACYDFDDCVNKSNVPNGGKFIALGGNRGYRLSDIDANAECVHNGGPPNSCAYGEPGSLTGLLCSHGTTQAEVGDVSQNCFTSPHDDWVDVSCSSATDVTVHICDWGDKACGGDPEPVSWTYAPTPPPFHQPPECEDVCTGYWPHKCGGHRMQCVKDPDCEKTSPPPGCINTSSVCRYCGDPAVTCQPASSFRLCPTSTPTSAPKPTSSPSAGVGASTSAPSSGGSRGAAPFFTGGFLVLGVLIVTNALLC